MLHPHIIDPLHHFGANCIQISGGQRGLAGIGLAALYLYAVVFIVPVDIETSFT